MWRISKFVLLHSNHIILLLVLNNTFSLLSKEESYICVIWAELYLHICTQIFLTTKSFIKTGHMNGNLLKFFSARPFWPGSLISGWFWYSWYDQGDFFARSFAVRFDMTDVVRFGFLASSFLQKWRNLMLLPFQINFKVWAMRIYLNVILPT